MWFDQMAIPADAPNPEAAHTFINFILDANNAAAATNYVWYASGNKAAQEFIDPEILEYPAVYPDAATLDNLFTTTPYPTKVQRVVTRLWTKIKSGT
jgi:putrescine transport system substrate-binding protein